MTLQTFTRQEHMTDHVQENYSIFGAVLELFLGKNIHHEWNVVGRGNVVTDDRDKLWDFLWDVIEVELAHADRGF